MTDYEKMKFELNENEQIEEIIIHSDGEEHRLVAFNFGNDEIKSVGFDVYNSDGHLVASFGVDWRDAKKVAEFFNNHLGIELEEK